MSMDVQGTGRRRKIAENFNRLSRVRHHYRQTGGTAIAYGELEHKFTFAKKPSAQFFDELSAVLETLVIYACPVVIGGDFDVRYRSSHVMGR